MTASLRARTFLPSVLAFALAFSFGWLSCRRSVQSIDDPELAQAVGRNQTRLLVIGIDGASWDIIKALSAKGRLPSLQRLIDEGGSGVLHSEEPMISPALWTTIATGQSRQAHGIDNFTFKPAGSYALEGMDSRVRVAPALWEILGHYRKKVAVVKWNSAWPAEPVNGIFIADNAGKGNLGPQYVYPPEWSGRLGAMELPRVSWFEDNFSRWEHRLLPKAYDEDRFTAGAAIEILKAEKPALLMLYFRNIDMVSHLFWKYRFPAGSQYSFQVSSAEQERYGDVIEKYYEFIDGLAGMVAGAAEGYQIIIISDHGEAASYAPANVFIELNNLLRSLGRLVYLESDSRSIDWSKTELFNLDDFHKDAGGIYLNLKGRDPQGTILFKDFESYRSQTIKTLSALKNEKGDKLFKSVRANPAKPKPMAAGPVDPPDVLVVTNPEVLRGRTILNQGRSIPIADVLWSYRDVSGDHAPEGVLIISGPGARRKAKLSASIYDLAPTILWLHDAPVGKDMPGKVLKNAFNYKNKKLKYVDSWTEKIKIPVSYQSRGMDQEQEQRLKALGYIK